MALASDSSTAAFAPEPFTPNDLTKPDQRGDGQAQTAFVTLRAALDGPPVANCPRGGDRRAHCSLPSRDCSIASGRRHR